MSKESSRLTLPKTRCCLIVSFVRIYFQLLNYRNYSIDYRYSVAICKCTAGCGITLSSQKCVESTGRTLTLVVAHLSLFHCCDDLTQLQKAVKREVATTRNVAVFCSGEGPRRLVPSFCDCEQERGGLRYQINCKSFWSND
jgi:hypothetical protein